VTRLLSDLGVTARTLARQSVVVTVVLSLAVGITASLALAALERSEANRA
jgi:hypothetical protein